MNKNVPQSTWKAISWHLTWTLLAFFIGQIIILIACGFLDRESLKVIRGLSTNDVLGMPAGVFSTVYLVAAYAMALASIVISPQLFGNRSWKNRITGYLATRRPISPKQVGVSILSYVPYVLISLGLTWLISLFVPGFNATQAQTTGYSADSLGLGTTVLIFLSLAVVAPLVEELIFRGFLFSRVRERCSFLWTTVIVSLTFAAVHGQPNIMVDAFVLSVAACYLREKTGSVWSGVVLHTVKNAIAVTILFV